MAEFGDALALQPVDRGVAGGDLGGRRRVAPGEHIGGIGHLPGVILGAVLLAALPEVLRYVAGPLQAMTDGRLDSAILRQLLIALAMISIMLLRPRGLWPTPEHGKARPLATGKVMPTTAQQNPPGIDFPADAVPGSTVRRQDAINP